LTWGLACAGHVTGSGTLRGAARDALVRAGAPRAQALTGGFHLAAWIAAALVGVALPIAMAVVPRPDGALTPEPEPAPGV
jgi:hypothetical protein